VEFSTLALHPSIEAREFTGLVAVRLLEREPTLVASLIKLLGIVTSALAACRRPEFAADFSRAVSHAPARYRKRVARRNAYIRDQIFSRTSLPAGRCGIER
jgi:hypothetical protein